MRRWTVVRDEVRTGASGMHPKGISSLCSGHRALRECLHGTGDPSPTVGAYGGRQIAAPTTFNGMFPLFGMLRYFSFYGVGAAISRPCRHFQICTMLVVRAICRYAAYAARYFCFAKSIYLFAIRYDINPTRPAGHIECKAHIERKAHIENPARDLYR